MAIFGSGAAHAVPEVRPEGFAVDEMPVGAVLEVETGHSTYRVENRGEGKVLISGHPTYCPEPVVVDLHGSVGGGALLKIWFIEPGSKMEFQHPTFGVVRTSRVRSVREIKPRMSS
jgi:hypothetical protein